MTDATTAPARRARPPSRGPVAPVPVPGSEVIASGDVVRDFQDRLARFARVIFEIAGVMLVAGWIADVVLPGATWAASPGRYVHTAAVIVVGAAWLVLRGPTLRPGVLVVADAALTIGLSTAWALLGLGAPHDEAIEFSILLASTYTIFARSVVVPSTTLRTAWISALAMAPTVVAFFARGMPFVPGAERARVHAFLLFSTLWCVTGVVTAALNSRRIYGLRERIREMGKLGQYTLAEKLGEGGMGVVYRAHHSMLRRPAAIKLLLPERSTEHDLARFEREVQLTSRLSHPNTISIFDYGRSADGAFYYVMEYLDGIDLDRLVEHEGPLPAWRVVHILAQVSGALAEAHALGLIHRDIKPANLILTERADEPDVVKVVDFGLVRAVDDESADASITRVGTIAGTPMYMSPEAISDPSTMDGRADLYAVGAAGYYLLTGRHVFAAANAVEMCSKHLTEEPVPPSQRVDIAIAADLERVILWCLAKRREDRPASAAALRAALLACSDAAAFDEAAARRWWAGWRTRRPSLTPASPHAPTMAIQWEGREALRRS
jgi:serine/threonine-protein kinase